MGVVQSRIRLPPGVFKEQPGKLLIRISHISMEAERRHWNTRQDLFVNHPLDTTRHRSRSLGDDGRTVGPDAGKPVNGGLLVALQNLNPARRDIVHLRQAPCLESLMFLQAFGQDRGHDETRHQ